MMTDIQQLAAQSLALIEGRPLPVEPPRETDPIILLLDRYQVAPHARLRFLYSAMRQSEADVQRIQEKLDQARQALGVLGSRQQAELGPVTMNSPIPTEAEMLGALARERAALRVQAIATLAEEALQPAESRRIDALHAWEAALASWRAARWGLTGDRTFAPAMLVVNERGESDWERPDQWNIGKYRDEAAKWET